MDNNNTSKRKSGELCKLFYHWLLLLLLAQLLIKLKRYDSAWLTDKKKQTHIIIIKKLILELSPLIIKKYMGVISLSIKFGNYLHFKRYTLTAILRFYQ